MSSSDSGTLGGLAEAMANARRLVRAAQYDQAAEQAREIIDGEPRSAEAYRLLGMALRASGRDDEAAGAEEQAVTLSSLHPDLFQAAIALAENRLDGAERLLRPYLKEQQDDAVALRLLAEIAARMARFDAAEELLEKSLSAAPSYSAARDLLKKIERHRASLSKSSDGIRPAPFADGPPEEHYAEALQLYEQVVALYPDSPQNWVSYGHVLRTVGRRADAVAAYRRAIGVMPTFGEAWWALADLKTRELDEKDVAALSALVDGEGPGDDDRIGLHFALGRALEHSAAYDASFRQYATGNALRSRASSYDCRAISSHVTDSIALFDEQFFRKRKTAGYGAPDPIFILGMPRSGSTLIEQILSSHPQVEGTMELPDICSMAKWLAGGKEAGFEASDYLPKLRHLQDQELTKLGQSYIWSTGLRRQTDRSFFTDKMPNNWLHLGMILAILPDAKIIDARRHPMACGLSLFRQHFAKGQEFSYDLTDIGSFYAEYVRMMDHFDRVMPGRVIRVIHEELVAYPDEQIRGLLSRLGLPFDERCLRFHENERAVRTSSSEQVRRPINREGVDQWRAFEPWLEPLKAALGQIAENYPLSR